MVFSAFFVNVKTTFKNFVILFLYRKIVNRFENTLRVFILLTKYVMLNSNSNISFIKKLN